MGKSIETRVTINAPASRVWQVLTALDKYKEWNPFIVGVEGKLQEGESLNVTFNNGFKISPRLVKVETDKELKWQGKLACGGLFDGEHRFVLREVNGQTELEHGENFSGLLIPFMSGLLKETEENFKKMNEGLKKRCEE